MAINVTADPLSYWSVLKGVYNNGIFVRDYTLDITYDTRDRDSAGVRDQGILHYDYDLSGIWLNITIDADPLEYESTLQGEFVEGVVAANTLLSYGYDLLAGIDNDTVFIIGPSGECFVWTSKIGSVSFEHDRSGEFTSRPMSWSGWIYKIKKLGKMAVVLGHNGVSIMTPYGTVWGLEDIWPVGLKGKNTAVLAKDFVHFIDKKGRLCTVSKDGLVSSIDYSNYLNSMSSNTIMIYDDQNDLVFITDGTDGYVLSRLGLGEGPANLTGIGEKAGTLSALTSTGVITFNPFAICINIGDLGTRREKTIQRVDLGLEADQEVQVALDYRWDKSSSFTTSPYVTVSKDGSAYIQITAVEFRLRIRQLVQEAIQLEYVNIILRAANYTGLGV